jgi:peptidoglycan/LPS O-acetylase OafA/YrhL
MREHVESGTEPVDGLRGLAILLVLAYHTWLFSWYTPEANVFGVALPLDVFARTGYLGVDLFFSISGFCLFLPCARSRLGGAPAMPLREFARRRLSKILPSYLLALLATLAAGLPLFHSAAELAWPLANHLLFINNAFNDVFGRHNSVLWSLAVEVQFYALFPLVAFPFARAPFSSAGLMIASAVAYRVLAARCCLQDETVTRQLPAYLDLFACGMLAAYLLVWLRRERPRIAERRLWFTFAALALAAAGFALLSACNAVQYLPQGRERWDVLHRSLLAAVAGGLALASCLAQRWWRRLVGNPLLVFLGLISYNLYLWHTLIMLWLLRHHVPAAATSVAHDDPHWRLAYITLGTLASLTLATALTYFLERPLLGTIKPQRFAFRWSRFTFRLARARARLERRT